MLEEMEEINVTVADIESLAAKLEGLEQLDAHEHATLAGVFMLAGQAVSYRADDVSGFSLNFTKGADRSLNFTRGADSSLNFTRGADAAIDFCRPGGLVSGFSWGLHGSGGGGGAGMPTDQ